MSTSEDDRDRDQCALIQPSLNFIQIIAIIFSMVAILGALATLTNQPFLFASVGPTAIIVAYNPLRQDTRFSSIILGHIVGIFSGLGALVLFGLYGLSYSAIEEGFTWARVGATSVAMIVTTIFFQKTPFYHPPAAATTLLVSLGILSEPVQVVFVIAGVVIIATIARFYKWFILWRYNNKDHGVK